MTRTLPALDTGLATLRNTAVAAGRSPLSTITPAEARERVTMGNQLCAGGPAVGVEDRVVTHDGHSVPVRVYAPGSSRTLVYAHGGGWVTGDLDYADEFCRFVASAGIGVVSVDYRLAPEHPFPAGLDDVTAVVGWALETTAGPVGVGGDSAGANLIASVCMTTRDSRGVLPAFQLLVYPLLDTDLTRDSYVDPRCAFPIGAADMAWFLGHYLASESPLDPRVAPLRAESHAGFPRTHVVLSGHDPLYDEGVAYASALTGAGCAVTVEEHLALCHGFLRFTAASAGAAHVRDALVTTVVGLFGEVTGS